MPIDDTTYGAQRGDVAFDSTGVMWTRATAAWRQAGFEYRRWIVPGLASFGGTSSKTPVRGMVYLQPFEVPRSMTLQKIFQVIGAASGTVRYAVYQDAGDTPATGAKVYDSGNVGAALLTSATVSYVALQGLYWLAETYSTSAPNFKIDGSGFNWGSFSDATFSYRAGSLASNTITLPSTAPAVTLKTTSACQWIITVA